AVENRHTASYRRPRPVSGSTYAALECVLCGPSRAGSFRSATRRLHQSGEYGKTWHPCQEAVRTLRGAQSRGAGPAEAAGCLSGTPRVRLEADSEIEGERTAALILPSAGS